jgi:hypothetical protein
MGYIVHILCRTLTEIMPGGSSSSGTHASRGTPIGNGVTTYSIWSRGTVRVHVVAASVCTLSGHSRATGAVPTELSHRRGLERRIMDGSVGTQELGVTEVLTHDRITAVALTESSLVLREDPESVNAASE